MFPSLNRLLSELYYHTDPSSPAAQNNAESVSLHCSHKIQPSISSSGTSSLLVEKCSSWGIYTGQIITQSQIFMEKIELLGNGASNSDLTLKKLSSDDSAIYYCAARETRCCGFPALLHKNVITNPYTLHHSDTLSLC